MEKVFLYKEKNSNDRDCVKYVDTKIAGFECGHYFGSLNIQGSCFSVGVEDYQKHGYDAIETILSEDEMNSLVKFNKDIHELGFGIEIESKGYFRGLDLCEKVQSILDKLASDENARLFEKIQNEEIAFLKNKFNLNDKDMDLIFDEYGLEYRDRSIIIHVYADTYELAQELLEQENYLELEDGRIVHLSY